MAEKEYKIGVNFRAGQIFKKRVHRIALMEAGNL